MTASESSSGRGRPSKVIRLLEEYELDGFGDELERRWTATEDRYSLRQLARLFNERLLEAALRQADSQPLDGEAENLHRLLTADEVSSADRTRARRQLERAGVDSEQLERDFVTYQAIRTYLKSHRNAEYTPDETDPLDRETTNLQQLRGRTVSVTEGKLRQLADSDALELGEFRTIVDIQVVCEDCNTQYDVVELLERGRCDCPTASDS